MSILHVLLPALARMGGGEDFARWLAKGDRLDDVADPRAAVTRAMFLFDGETIPVAALRHHVRGNDAGSGVWVCADPAHVRSEVTGARLMAWPVMDIGSDEVRALSLALMPLFRDLGLVLAVDTASSWSVRLPAAPEVPFVRPVDALGADLLDCLPQGEPGRYWRRLFTEAQVVLHAHPVNAERTAAGKLPVNALWFWGAGPLPAPVESRLALLASSDDTLRGLGKLAGIPCSAPAPGSLDVPGQAGDVLLDLDVRDPGSVWSRWLPRFRQGLRERRFTALELLFPSGERFRVRHTHRLRWWRRG